MPRTAISPARTRRRLRKRLRKLSTRSMLSLFDRRGLRNALLLLGVLIALIAGLLGLFFLGRNYAGPGALTTAILLVGLTCLAAAEAALEAWWRRPGLETVARRLDTTLGLGDRVAAAWSCLAARREDAVADALVLRAMERTTPPHTVRRRRYVLFAVFAVIGLVQLSIFLFVLILLLLSGPPGECLPLFPGRTEAGPIPTVPSGGDRAGVAETAKATEDDPEPDDPDQAAGPDEPAPPREIETELYPELPSYSQEGPVPMTARVQARNDDPRTVEGRISVRVDDGPFVPLPGTVEIPGGRAFDRLRGFDLRQAVAESGGLSGGTHRVQIAFERSDGAEPTVSEEVEIFVESSGDSGGGDGEEEKPEEKDEPEPEPPPPSEPPPGGEEPPPPEPPPATPDEPPPTLLIKPLFQEGETVRKVGPTLQFDPAAPRGDPPRQRTLEQAFPELRRRAEDAVSRDEVPSEWRALVRRYFDLIRPE